MHQWRQVGLTVKCMRCGRYNPLVGPDVPCIQISEFPPPRPISEPFPFRNHRTLAEVWGLATGGNAS